ncbi:MAG TPA: hypothetical protein VH062_25315 [Polyangiaceae bacterium]|nr:hypothetical protein [Polyangiaceae bacterium]
MAKPFEDWTVLPHGGLSRVDDNMLTVTGLLDMPAMGKVQRRMTVVRLNDGDSVVYSAICLDEPEMASLEAFGTPRYLIVPSDIHRMDAKAWKKRYPALTVIAPAHAREKVEEIAQVDGTELILPDPSVRLVGVPGTDERELALIVETRNGTTLILNDVIFNLANGAGFKGWLFEKIGMTGDEPHVPPPIKMRQVKDAQALSAQLTTWAHLPKLQRVIVSHGEIIANDPAGVLERIAKELAA